MNSKQILTAFFLFLASLQAFSQYCPSPMGHGGIFEAVFWETSEVDSQKIYWNNGQVKVENEKLNDGLILRKEYYKNGNLKLTSEMTQEWSRDSIFKHSPYTGKDTMVILEGYIDSPFGKYTRYSIRRADQPIFWGKLNGRTKKGVWRRFQFHQLLMVANFNKHGKMEGFYHEFSTRNFQLKTSDTLWSGQYRVLRDTNTYMNPISGRIDTTIRRQSIRTGTWRHYKRGELMQTVNYNWLKD